MRLTYDRYLDQILGGWIGNSLGGAIGARFEGNKGWIEIRPEEMFPPQMPPNDDLDLQVLWLKVLEERGAALTADDLAAAWLEWCWYPFNEYGIFRRNWRLGIHPPASGRYANQFWETGLGCPIRAQIWGYAFPGAPDLAARYAELDGSLDHTEQSIGAEMMMAAMVSMAFFVPDMRRLAALSIGYLPKDTPIERLVRTAFESYDEGLSLREARDRVMALAGVPEACDAQINVPFTFLGLLYGGGDLQETLLAALRCGYDTDSTLAMCGALVGQLHGASQMPESLRRPVGDELVMGIRYRRPQMSLSALARDTARVGALLARECHTGTQIDDAPHMPPLPDTSRQPETWLTVEYDGLPAAAPADTVSVTIRVGGRAPDGAMLTVDGPSGWTITPATAAISPERRTVRLQLHAPADVNTWPMRNIFTARLQANPPLTYSFGIAGAGLWRLLGVYYDALPNPQDPAQLRRRFNHHFVSLQHAYLPEPDIDMEAQYQLWSRRLGRPALLASYEHEVDLSRLVGLRGPYCAYLARTIVSPDDRSIYLVVGNTDGYRLYLNGALIAEIDEQIAWTPFNNVHRVGLRSGPNQVLLKLLKSGDSLRFTLGLRADTGDTRGHNCEDWAVDLSESLQ
jgi:ADP-ribosylglycohydrolase